MCMYFCSYAMLVESMARSARRLLAFNAHAVYSETQERTFTPFILSHRRLDSDSDFWVSESGTRSEKKRQTGQAKNVEQTKMRRKWVKNRLPTETDNPKNKEIHCEKRETESDGRETHLHTYTLYTRSHAPSLTSRFLASVSLFRDGPDGHVAACSAYPRAVCTPVRFVGLPSAAYSHLA